MQKIESSNIDSIGYDDDKMTMIAKFKTGNAYQYLDISRQEYEEILNSQSPGSKLKEITKFKEYSKI